MTLNLERTGALVTVKLWVPHKEKKPTVAPIEVTGMIDTGTKYTVILEGTGARLGLTPAGRTTITTATTKDHECYEYCIRVLFPQGTFADVLAIECPWPDPSIHCFIGRNALKNSTFTYNGLTNMFTLSF